MLLRKFPALVLLLLSHSFSGLSQPNVSVDHQTGTMGYAIPLTTISTEGIPVSIGLSYTASGVMVGQTPDEYGIGWSLYGTGQISRVVMGLPDDMKPTSVDSRRGWLEGGAEKVSPFIQSTASSCASTGSIWNTVTNNWGSTWQSSVPLYDSEPDVYSVSAPGLSATFVYDNSKNIRVLSGQELQITYARSATGEITSFVVKSDNGYEYHFSEAERSSTASSSLSGNPGTVQYMAYDYRNYGIATSYNSSWRLAKIYSPTKREIAAYAYAPASSLDPEYNTKAEKMHVNCVSQASCEGVGEYTLTTRVYKRKLLSISGGSSIVKFIDNREIGHYYKSGATEVLLRKILLEYDYATKETNGLFYLSAVTEENDCQKNPPYRFVYKDPSLFPAAGSKSVDLWGFFGSSNLTLRPKLYVYPSEAAERRYQTIPLPAYAGQQVVLAGADRAADGSKTDIGTLKSVVLPSGGSIDFEYQPNRFVWGSGFKEGAGIRIHRISMKEGLGNDSQVLTKEYQYESSSGATSGVLITMPQFTIPTGFYRGIGSLEATGKTYNQLRNEVSAGARTEVSLWDMLLVRSESDLSKPNGLETGAVVYSKVTERVAGKGRTEYEYRVAGAWGGAPTADWKETSSSLALTFDNSTGSSLCPDIGAMGGGPYTFPFAPSPNYDFERGLLTKVSMFTEAEPALNKPAEPVSMKEYFYTRLPAGSALPVYGVVAEPLPTCVTYQQYDEVRNRYTTVSSAAPQAFAYAKYVLNTQVASALSEERETLFVGPNHSASVTTSKKYTYGGRLLASTSSIASDNSEVKSYFYYPKDYSISTSTTNEEEKAILALKTANQLGTPVEVVQTVKGGDGVEKVSQATLVRYSFFGKPYPLASSVHSFNPALPTATFRRSNQGPGFTPDANPSYLEQSRNIGYDDDFQPLGVSSRKGAGRVQATHLSHGGTLPTLSIVGAQANEVLHDGFESGSRYGLGGNGVLVEGRGQGLSVKKLTQGQKMWQNLSVGAHPAYRFRAWVKASAPGSLRIHLKSSNGQVLAPVAVAYQGGDWQMVEVNPISVAGLSGTVTFELESVDAQEVLIDDLTFWPATAQVATSAFNPAGQLVRQTDMNGRFASREYDRLGNLLYERDHRDQIRTVQEKLLWDQKSNISAELEAVPNSAAIKYQDYVTVTPVIFKVTSCEVGDGYQYKWNFGDGTGDVWGGAQMSHVFQNTSESSSNLTIKEFGYPVTVTVITPNHGQVTLVKSITVYEQALSLSYCVTGPSEIDLCGINAPVQHPCGIGNNPSTTATTYSITGVTGHPAGATITYQWQKSIDGGKTFPDILGATGSTFSASTAFNKTSYAIRCVVRVGSAGRANYSTVWHFTASYSQRPCSQ
ncbi:hypothetical protein GU926_11150 [Nibribacter ruber]|uniref:PKD domain-containing protein n=1 Tax=Nibribacter ruber TaxID=2698458 RepID=A0A6P1NVT9_9BACT|nr:PKD domain-containing protein [Nibribacter ruber]QHL87956.1 hypothetical protein GU926_11150 [Nibribacter ruber]